MKQNTKNISKSIKQKLLNYAQKNHLNFNMILIQFFNERMLYRISVSDYSSNFILKGALLFLAHDISRFRLTKDIDLLGSDISNDIEDIKEIFYEISNINYEDGVIFDPDSLSVQSINEPDEYNGVRLKIAAKLDSARQRIQIDIGYGDIVFPAPVQIDFPVVLDLEPPKIFAYSLETAISEKFEAIVSLGLSNSRMKDFYDIYFLASSQKFNSSDLKTSIIETFKRRITNLEDRKYIFKDSFMNDNEKQIMWSAFLNRNQINIEFAFSEILNKIQNFIEPIISYEGSSYWESSLWEWIRTK
jgi:hypothetical protein